MTKDRLISPFILDNPIRRVFMPPTKVVDRFRDYLRPGMTLLDVGSGPGFFLPILSKLVGEEGKVWAVDPDPRAIERIRKRGLSNVEPRIGTASSLDFLPDKSVDFVFSNLVLCCLLDHEGAVKEMLRVMKDGSKAYISVTRSRGKDPRNFRTEEWRDLESKLKIIRRGSSIMELWMLAEKPGIKQ
ncbi:class I SAM-dependent methyltransferase [Metallosphaera cuprina]|nr:class I SAM-dependent methyltransferase [Metallosphaera cuprina]